MKNTILINKKLVRYSWIILITALVIFPNQFGLQSDTKVYMYIRKNKLNNMNSYGIYIYLNRYIQANSRNTINRRNDLHNSILLQNMITC